MHWELVRILIPQIKYTIKSQEKCQKSYYGVTVGCKEEVSVTIEATAGKQGSKDCTTWVSDADTSWHLQAGETSGLLIF